MLMTELTKSYSRLPATGKETRDCTYPWFFFMITSRREVKPCCVHPPIAVLENGASLDDILNGATIRELRRGLLTGDLNPTCATCASQPVTNLASLQRRVRAELLSQRGQKDGRGQANPATNAAHNTP
jgi:hypothetical protein